MLFYWYVWEIGLIMVEEYDYVIVGGYGYMDERIESVLNLMK